MKRQNAPEIPHLVNEMLHRAQMECSAADRIPKVGSENFQFKTVVKNQGLCALLEVHYIRFFIVLRADHIVEPIFISAHTDFSNQAPFESPRRARHSEPRMGCGARRPVSIEQPNTLKEVFCSTVGP